MIDAGSIRSAKRAWKEGPPVPPRFPRICLPLAVPHPRRRNQASGPDRGTSDLPARVCPRALKRGPWSMVARKFFFSKPPALTWARKPGPEKCFQKSFECFEIQGQLGGGGLCQGPETENGPATVPGGKLKIPSPDKWAAGGKLLSAILHSTPRTSPKLDRGQHPNSLPRQIFPIGFGKGREGTRGKLPGTGRVGTKKSPVKRRVPFRLTCKFACVIQSSSWHGSKTNSVSHKCKRKRRRTSFFEGTDGRDGAFAHRRCPRIAPKDLLARPYTFRVLGAIWIFPAQGLGPQGPSRN